MNFRHLVYSIHVRMPLKQELNYVSVATRRGYNQRCPGILHTHRHTYVNSDYLGCDNYTLHNFQSALRNEELTANYVKCVASNQRPPRALFCLKLGNSCCYARYSCGNNCIVVVKLLQEYHCFLYTFYFRSAKKKFAANDMFLREVNSYERELALRNLRLISRSVIF